MLGIVVALTAVILMNALVFIPSVVCFHALPRFGVPTWKAVLASALLFVVTYKVMLIFPWTRDFVIWIKVAQFMAFQRTYF